MIIEFLNNNKTHIFVTIVILIHYVLYILLYLNINLISKKYVNILNAILQISISSFLIFRFWIYNKSSVISDFDRRVIITSATFMLLNAITIGLFNNYETKIRDYLSEKLHININNDNNDNNEEKHWTQLTPMPPSPYVYVPIRRDHKIEDDKKDTKDKNNESNPIYDYLPDETKIKNKFE
uniref:Uncharacterized protein n=1 Tax=viral metagenome TaxID=1070528 RepID=A0A6C0HZ17_9ZZZZ